MTEIICQGLNGGVLSTNRYKAKSGKEYIFDRGCATKVKDPEDAKYFLNCGDGTLFVKKGTIAKVIEAIIPSAKGVNTEKELYAMNRKEQVELLKELGNGNGLIPSREKGRVELIQKLQGGDE